MYKYRCKRNMGFDDSVPHSTTKEREGRHFLRRYKYQPTGDLQKMVANYDEAILTRTMARGDIIKVLRMFQSELRVVRRRNLEMERELQQSKFEALYRPLPLKKQ